MVAVVSGAGLGLFGSSISVLGGAGAVGSSGVGRGNDRVFVNSATGNLIIQSQDERLSALGLDLSLIRTYNSQGQMNDDNGDNWRLGVHQRVYGFTAGSKITKVFGDGREVVYTYDANGGQPRYVSTEGDGAHDTLTNNAGTWTWTDGSGRNTETYNSDGVLTQSRDADGNTVSYTYLAGLLRQITDASGQATYLEYSGSNLTQIRVVSNGLPQSLTHYTYDASNRLIQVRVDLTPDNNSIADNNVYTTSYTYDGDGTSRRIASISQGDGSSVAFTYQQIDGEYRVRTYTDGEGRVTTLTYNQSSASGSGPTSAAANAGVLSTSQTQPYSLNTGPLTTPSGWLGASLLETSGTSASEPKVAFDANGNGFAVWAQGGDVLVRRYTAATNYWAPGVVLDSRSETVYAPVLAVDSAGNAIVAWVQSDGTASSIYARAFSIASGNWESAARTLESSSQPVEVTAGSVAVAMRAGYAAVAWLQSNGTNSDLYASVLDTGTWYNASSPIETNVNPAAQPSIAIDADINMSVVWRQSDGTVNSIYANRYSSSNWDWGTASPLELSSTAASDPKLVFDANGNGLAVWSQGGDIYARRYTRSNNTWAPAIPLDTRTESVYAPSLSIDTATGDAIAAWVQSDGTANSVYVSRYTASTNTWSTTPTLLETSSQPVAVTSGSLVTSVRGSYAAVAWLQSDGTVNNLYASRFNGTSWVTQLLETSADAAASPSVAVDVQGYVSVLWQQSDGTASSIYQTRYNLGSGGEPYYLVPASPSWQSIANTLYGVNSAAAGSALQAVMGSPTLTPGLQLTGLPATLNVTTTVPAYYTVVAGDTWPIITQKIYLTSDANAVAALQAALGSPTPTLSTGLQLTVPLTLNYGGGSGSGGASTLYLQTQVQDALGLLTIYTQDPAGRLTGVTVGGAGGVETRYTYGADGNLVAITEDPTGLNRVTNFSYDANGNLLSTRDSLGNTVTRTYDNSTNQLLSETQYLVRDPDGAGSSPATVPMTTRYAYDAENHLRFVISADGRVTEHQYDAAGQRTVTLKYTGVLYAAAPFAEADLIAWRGAQNLTQLERTEYGYDFRGNLSTLSRYNTTNSSGAGTGTASITQFVYDQRGQLLQTLDARGSATTPNPGSANTAYATTYTYDGLGRVLSNTRWIAGGTLTSTLSAYDDANRMTVTTLANGLNRTETYNRAGELISVIAGGSSTSYAYDAGGRLRISTDVTTGVRQFYLYDEAGRKSAQIDGDGTLTEFIYDRASEPIKTVQYSTSLDAATLASLVNGSGNPTNVTLATLRAVADDTPAQDRVTRSVYNAAGQRIYAIDEVGAVTQYFYDGAGRLTDEVRYATPVSIARSVDQVLQGSFTVNASADDRHTRHFYNYDGRLTGTLDSAQYLTAYRYDEGGRLVEQISYANRVLSSTWRTDTLAQLTTSAGTDEEIALDPERDLHSYFFYDGQGRKIGVLDAEGYLTETVYTVAGQVSQVSRYDRALTYSAGVSTFQTLKTAASAAPAVTVHTTSYQYDGAGRVTQETNYEGTVTAYSYNGVDELTGITRDTRTTETRYDLLGRVIQELTAEGRAQITGGMSQAQIDDVWNRYGITYNYDLAGRRISAVQRPNDTQTNTTLYYYDNDGRLRFEVNAAGERTEYRYNALNQRTDAIRYYNRISTAGLTGGLLTTGLTSTLSASADATRDARTSYAYTLTGKITSLTTAEGASTTYTYNAFGELDTQVEQIDATRTLTHTYRYDQRGLLALTRWDPTGLNTTEARQYDAFGRLTQLTDARGNTSRIEYDRLGRQIATVDALNGRRLTTYDGFSRTLTTRDALLNTTSYTYNDATRTATVTTPEGIVVSTVHTRHGQTLSVTAAGNTTTYAYDLNGQVTGISDSQGTLASRTYDRAGRQITATDARGTITSFTYDAANRVLNRTQDSAGGGLSLTTSYVYDGEGRVTDVTDPNGTLTRTSYDRDSRVTQVAIDPIGLNLRTAYTYDRQGHVATVTEGVGSANPRRTQYLYDALGRRIEEIVDPTSLGGALNLRTQYKYDANGNLTHKIDARGNSTWNVYDADNRLRYTVDALGGVTETTYDAENRVTATRRYATAIATAAFGDVVTDVTLTASSLDRITQSVYDKDGREKYTIDSSGGVTERTFDDAGRVTRTRLYAIPVASASYTSAQAVSNAITDAGNSTLTLSANDRVQWTAYDLRGHKAFTVDGLGAVTQFLSDGNGNVTSSTAFATLRSTALATDLASLQSWALANVGNTANRTTRAWYDTADRLRFTLDAEGYLTESRYTDATRQQTNIVYAGTPTVAAGATLANVVTAAVGIANIGVDQSTTTLKDVAGRVKRITDTLGNYDEFGYDEVGNKTSFRNKANAVWTYEYDANHRLTYERSPSVAVTTITDAGSTLTSATSSQSIVTRIEYDALGNVRFRTEAYGTAQARMTEYQYDTLGRQTRTVYPTVGIYNASSGDSQLGNGAAINRTETSTPQLYSEIAYDTLGNAFRSRDVAGNYSYKIYDRLNRVQYEIDAERYVTQYAYDTFGNQKTLTRYAQALSSELPSGTNSLPASALNGLLTASSTEDRVISTSYDRLNRVVQVTRPTVSNFQAAAGTPGGVTFSAGATTISEYDAFGKVNRTRELINPNTATYADTYFYYDKRGLKTAQVDALKYLTVYEYDETGDLKRQVEYSRPLSGTPTTSSYGTPTITTAGTSPSDPAGYDRETLFAYDRLNRKVSETKVGVVHTTISGTTTSTATGNQVTTFGYDVLGNQTRMTKVGVLVGGSAVDVHTYTYYDVLGRVTAVAEPPRDRGDGVTVTPLTLMRRDAYGNMVEETRYINGAAGTPNELAPPTPQSVDGSLDRTTRMLFDSHGHAIRTEDATGADRFASYNARGEVAKEWQAVTNDGATDYLVTFYQYDKLGHQVRLIEPQRYSGGTTVTVTNAATFNAFGEIVFKGVIDGSPTAGQQEYFQYDQAGRLWRTNSGDGINKVYQHDLAGNVTAEIRSKTLNLASTSYLNAASVGGLTADVMRTETRYDALGRVREQRLPTFSNSSGLEAINSTFAIGELAGPSNPAAIYKLTTLDYGYGAFQAYVVDPTATLAQGGGYYLNSAGNYVQTSNHQIVTAVRINWNAPTDASVEAKFEYRALGSTDPNAWASVPVGALVGNKIGVNVSSLQNQTFEYRITYRRRTETAAYAEATGSFRVEGTSQATISISQNPADPASEVAALNLTHADGFMTWTAPTDTTVNATLRLRPASTSSFTDISASRSGQNFSVNVRTPLAVAGTYDYEIVYTRNNVVIARKVGQLTSTGQSQPRVVDVTNPVNNALTFDAAQVGTVTGAAGASVSSVIATRATPEHVNVMEFPEPYQEYYWNGTNQVNLNWGNPGASRVMVRLEFMTQAINGAASVADFREKIFTSGETSGSISWGTSARERTPQAGGIDRVTRVIVYTENSPNSNTWTPRYNQPSPPPNLGKSVSWDIVPNVTPTFEIRAIGGSYAPRTISTSGPRWTVDLSDLPDTTYEYRIQYRIGGRLTSEQTGRVAISSGSTAYTTTTTTTSDSPPAAPQTVGTVIPQNAVTVSSPTITSTANPKRVGPVGDPESWRWTGNNAVSISYSDVGTTSVRLRIFYTPRGTGAQPTTYPLTGGPAAATSSTLTSASVSWSGETAAELFDPGPGGINTIQRVQVFAADGTTLLRDTAVGNTPPRLTWAAPSGGVVPLFGYRIANSGSSFTYVTPVNSGGQLSTDLTGLTSPSYEYWIGYQRPGESYYASGATGTFSVSGASITLNSQTPFNNTPSWLSGVSYTGSSVTWTQAPQAGASVAFEYWNGSSWVPRSYSSSGSTYYVDMSGLSAGNYSYRITYRNAQSTTYLSATGTATVNVIPNVVPPSVGISGTANSTWPTINISPVNINNERISWNYAARPGSRVEVQYRVAYNGTLYTKTAEGTSPSFGMTFSEVITGWNPVSYQIFYYEGAQTDPYAMASGSAVVTISYPTIYPTITVNSQAAAYPSGLQPVATPAKISGDLIGWTTAAESGATVKFRYQDASGGDWTELPVVSNPTQPDGYINTVDLLPVVTGTYKYEITYTRAGQTQPYAGTSGALGVTRTVNVTNYTFNPDTPASLPSISRTPTQSQELDRWGNAIAVTDVAANTTNYRYNQLNQLIEIKQPEVTVVSTIDGQVIESRQPPVSYNYYDLAGRLIATRDANGNVNRTTYNAAGQLLAETHADGGVKDFDYNAFGENVALVDELGFETRNTYDRAGRLTNVAREVAIDGFTTPDPDDVINDSYAYDEAGRRIAETNGENETVRYYYDLHGNLARRRTHLNANTYYEYDAQDHKTREQDAIGGVMTWGYDFFGKMTAHKDLGNVNYSYAYNLAGLQSSQTSSAGQNMAFDYDAAGHLTQINDTGVNRVTSYSYDAAGRRSREKTKINGLAHQDTSIEYDEQSRVKKLSDLRYGVTYSYDAQGNRTHTAATYYDHQQQQQTQDLWYTYDSMNRVLISQGANTFNQVGISATQGIKLTYDLAGQRKTAETTGPQKIVYEDIEVPAGGNEWSSTPRYYLTTGNTTERYTYDGLGRLKKMERSGESRVSHTGHTVTVSTRWDTLSERTYDKASRETYEESRVVESDNLIARRRTSAFNDDGQLTSQTTLKQDVTYGWQSESTVNYTFDAANVLRSYNVAVYRGSYNPAYLYTSTYTNSYLAADSYLDAGQAVSSVGTNPPGSGSTARTYNVNRELATFTDSQNTNNNRYFANGANGTALTAVQGNISNTAQAFTDALARADNGVRSQHFFTANGESIGSFGQLQSGNKFKANFDVNYTPVSDEYPSSVPTTVIAQAGDTLRTLAARIFGDGSLWYVLAEANGLTGADTEINEGTIIQVPNEVVSPSNTSSSFKPFNVKEAIGDTSPTQPAPPAPKKGCGIIGQILVIVVAIVVTYFTAGAASGVIGSALGATAGSTAAVVATVAGGVVGAAVGSAASQGVAIAIGQQQSFSWKAVGAAALSAGLAPGVSAAAGSLGSQVLNAAINSAVNQGVNIALGLQDGFNWTAVAAAAVAAPVANYAGGKVGTEVGKAFGSKFAAETAAGLTAGFVNQLAYASFTGGQINYAQLAADAFGNVLGNSIVDGMAPQPIGITDDQWADMDRQLSADVAASQAGLDPMFSRDLGRMSANLSREAAVARDMRVMDRDLGQTLTAGNATALDKVLRNIKPPEVRYDEESSVDFMQAQRQAVADGVPTGESQFALADRLASDPAAATGSVDALSPWDSFKAFNPIGRTWAGLIDRAAKLRQAPQMLLLNGYLTAQDELGLVKDAIFGPEGSGEYRPITPIGRSIQEEGLMLALGQSATSAIRESPPVAMMDSLNQRDWYGVGGALTDTLLMLAAPELLKAPAQAWKGAGPIRGTFGVDPASQSVKGLQNFYPKREAVEFVYDPSTSTFVVGNGLMKHEPLAAAIGADSSRVVGGIFSRGPNGTIFTNEKSGHFWQNWTPPVRQQYIDFMQSKGLDLVHKEGM